MLILFKVHETEIKEMFDVADHDNNGHIGFKEFMVNNRILPFSVTI
jgi:Ca2+-binding EF-hand superfamily protein